MSQPPESLLGFQPFIPDLQPFFLQETGSPVQGVAPKGFTKEGRIRQGWASQQRCQVTMFGEHPILDRLPVLIKELFEEPPLSVLIDKDLLERLIQQSTGLTPDTASQWQFRRTEEFQAHAGNLLRQSLIESTEKVHSGQRLFCRSLSDRPIPALPIAKKMAAIAYVLGQEWTEIFLVARGSTLWPRTEFTWRDFSRLLSLFARGEVKVYDLEKQFQLARRIILASLKSS